MKKSIYLPEDLIDFLDGHKMTISIIQDIEYVADKISNWIDYGGIKYSDKKALKLAQTYYELKLLEKEYYEL